MNDEFRLDVRKEYFNAHFDEHVLESMSDEENYILRRIFD